MQPYPNTPGRGMPQYSQEWQGSDLEGTVAATSDSYEEQAISDYSYPQVRFLQLPSRARTQCSNAQPVQPEGMKPDTSFRDTLRDIEYTFYKTFPAAAHAAQSNQSWDVFEEGEYSQDRVMYFYPSSGTPMKYGAPSLGPTTFASAPSGRARATSDVDMTSSIHAALKYHPATQPSLSASSPPPVVHQGHPSAPVCPDFIVLLFFAQT
ncbi:hypothetical protein EST38_g235 [Candolleomyces aberdarensis]|uniref:Uncharacterized protein n=1 Tax=Candolleomyces aberdarensis TaxID=2316362 RepID=A0A4Q2E165_9AGAR|nr:hypothetical protein EST38_g235 [Candolleomyces aberdarensis]